MSELCHFSTVEDFWRYFSHIPKPSQVFFDGDCKKRVGGGGTDQDKMRTVEEYSLFKKGIEPEWGDPANVNGGEWFCRQYVEPDVLDLYWQNLVMGVIGETIEDACNPDGSAGDYINGVRVLDKSRGFPMFKLEIWIKTKDEAIRNRIKNTLRNVITDGQPSNRKTQPKFDWKDHS